jgi:hypothetical protein
MDIKGPSQNGSGTRRFSAIFRGANAFNGMDRVATGKTLQPSVRSLVRQALNQDLARKLPHDSVGSVSCQRHVVSVSLTWRVAKTKIRR